MLNKSTSCSEYVVQSGVTPYPIGFAFQYNGDDTPQIRVTIGDMVAVENLHFVITEDLLNIKLIPLEEDAPEDPNDYSWMDKWVGMPLVIERDIPFVQESDYQLGRISPERIEKDFDLAVMRDQEIRNQANKDRATIQECQRNISSNAEAIQKARDDFSAEDAKINKRIDGHAEELDAIREVQTTANANIESNAKAIQKARDDFTAADSVLRKDIDGNKSDITKLRDNMNASDASLQGQITAQAAKIATKQNKLTAGDNIIISGDVISATGAGGGVGFDVIVVQELPESGEKGIIYLVPKDGAAPDVFDEYVWVTTTSTFELIGSTKVDLTDYATKGELAGYLPLAGGTMTGTINYDTDFGKTKGSTIILSAAATTSGFLGQDTEYGSLQFTSKGEFVINNSLDPIDMEYAQYLVYRRQTVEPANDGTAWLGSRSRRFLRVYTKSISNGGPTSTQHYDIAVPEKSGTMATIEDIAAIGGDGATGQVLTKTDDGFAWQEPAGGTKVIFREWEE